MTSPQPSLVPAGRRWPWGLLTLDVVFFTVAAIFVVQSPCGRWKNQVMGVEMWWNLDPGGIYVVSSLFYVGIDRYPSFVGHPGLTLQLMIGLLARAMYTVHRVSGGQGPYLTYCAQHFRNLFVMAGLLVAALHVVSFHALYAVAKRILDDAGAAFLAVLAYATLFPTLYFSTRVSVEPLLVTFFLCTFLCLWNVRERLNDRSMAKACVWAVLAAVSATAAMFTKFHLCAPLVPLALLQLLLQPGNPPAPMAEPRRRFARLGPAACFVASAVIAGLLFTLKFNWRYFFDTWFQYTPGGKTFTPTQNRAQDYVSNSPAMARNTWKSFQEHCADYLNLTRLTSESLFTIAEGLFVVLAVVGLVWFWRRRPDKRSLLFWPILYGIAILPVVAYRGLWHYFFLHLAFASIFAAFCIRRLLARFGAARSSRADVARTAGVILIIHGVSIVFFFNSKAHDVVMYRQTLAPYHQAMEQLRLPGRIAVVAAKQPNVWWMHGIYDEWVPSGKPLRAAMRRLFVPVADAQNLTRDFAATAKVKVVIDLRNPEPRVVPISDWTPPPATRPTTQPTTRSP